MKLLVSLLASSKLTDATTVGGCAAISYTDEKQIPTSHSMCSIVGARWNFSRPRAVVTSNSVTISNPVCTGGCDLDGDNCPNNLVDILSGNTITTCDSCQPDGVKERKFVVECPGDSGHCSDTSAPCNVQISYFVADSCICPVSYDSAFASGLTEAQRDQVNGDIIATWDECLSSVPGITQEFRNVFDSAFIEALTADGSVMSYDGVGVLLENAITTAVTAANSVDPDILPAWLAYKAGTDCPGCWEAQKIRAELQLRAFEGWGTDSATGFTTVEDFTAFDFSQIVSCDDDGTTVTKSTLNERVTNLALPAAVSTSIKRSSFVTPSASSGTSQPTLLNPTNGASSGTTPATCSAATATSTTTLTGLVENNDGTAGCPPTITSWAMVFADAVTPAIPVDPNQQYGVHYDGKSYIGAGVGIESESVMNRVAFLSRYNLCSDVSTYGQSATSTYLGITQTPGTANCLNELVWAWKSNNPGKNDAVNYVAVSPDKTYVIAAGVIEVSTTVFQRWLVKLDASTGAEIWKIQFPETDAGMGNKSGFESIAFTADGGFIAGGFANRQGAFPFFKSAGAVDDGNPIFQKFSKATADAVTMSTPPTPQWTWQCGGTNNPASTLANKCPLTVQAAVNTMRVFTHNNVEQVVTTFRPNNVVILNANTGEEMNYADLPLNVDKYQDVEVEVDSTGAVTGFIIGGLTKGQDTVTPGCSFNAGGYCTAWEGLILRLPYDLSAESWRKSFSDFTGGVGPYSGYTPYGGAMVYTECWSVKTIPTGYVLACGQGIENCNNQEVASTVLNQCTGTNGASGDHRINWRGLAIAFTHSGAFDWYRMDNWGPAAGETLTASSAYEWVSYDPSDPTTLVFFSDEAAGFGFSTMDLNTAATIGTGTASGSGSSSNTCYDSSTPTGLKENADGTGGCPPPIVQWSAVDSGVGDPLLDDANQSFGFHLDARTYIGVGVGNENNGGTTGNAIVTRYNLCNDLTQYSSNTAHLVALSYPEGSSTPELGTQANCGTSLGWVKQFGVLNKIDTLLAAAAHPDGQSIIVVGVRQHSGTVIRRWILKLNAADGSTIWETEMLETDANMGNKSGYESIKFTSDGGFIAGGFANFDEDGFPNFKSGGQVDRGNPIYQKFAKSVADATTMASPPTPTWTWSCGGGANNPTTSLAADKQCPSSVKSSANTMRIFTSGGVEQIVSTFRPSIIVIVNAVTGAEMNYATYIESWPNNVLVDKYQDIEVEFDSSGTATAFVVAGLSKVQDKTTLGCSTTSLGHCDAWNGLALKVPYDLSAITWRKEFTDFPGGITEYAGTTRFGGAMVYTECWSITSAPVTTNGVTANRYILACGQGIENCESTQVDASLITQCNSPDPRRDWRGLAIAFTPDGTMDWYRMANLGLFPGDTSHGSSAFEWVSYGGDPSTLAFFADETLGFSFVTMDLTGGSGSTSGSGSGTTTSSCTCTPTSCDCTCCNTLNYVSGEISATFQKTTSLNDGVHYYTADDGTSLWWMWHGDVGHWVANSTPGTHGNDLLAGTHAAFACPDAITNWTSDGTVHTFTCHTEK